VGSILCTDGEGQRAGISHCEVLLVSPPRHLRIAHEVYESGVLGYLIGMWDQLCQCTRTVTCMLSGSATVYAPVLPWEVPAIEALLYPVQLVLFKRLLTLFAAIACPRDGDE
jgi:hypothetical protein